MTEWLAHGGVVMIATLVVLLPGLAISFALGLRGLLLWGFAPAGGVAVLAVGAIALGLVGVPWSVWSAGAVAAAICAVTAAIGWLLRTSVEKNATPRNRSRFLVPIAVVIGTVAGAVRMATIIGSPAQVSQTNDATFHLNVLRFIADSGHASSLDVLGTIDAGGFYPAAWHAVTSLTAEIAHVDGSVAANATSLMIAGPVWALSVAALIWVVTRDRVATAAGAALAPLLFGFPFLMLDFGVLYPYALSLAVLPGVIAASVACVDEAMRTQAWRAFGRLVLTVGVGLVGIALSQPSTLLVWLIAVVAVIVTRVLTVEPGTKGNRAWGRVAVAAGVVLISVLLWLAMVRISAADGWRAVKPALPAATEMLLNSSAGAGPALVISALAVGGFVLVLGRREQRWLAVFGAALAVLVLAAVSVQNDLVRDLLAPWYADPRRFIAMMPLVVIPFAAIGLAALAQWAGRRGARVGATLALVLVAVAYVETVVWATVLDGPKNYYDYSDSPYLSDDEAALLQELDEHVDEDETVLGNPSAGAAFGYALSGVDVVPRTWAMPTGEDFQTLRSGLVDLAEDPEVCAAVERMDVDLVLDFGDSAVGAGKWDMPGMTGFAEAEGFELVAASGDASLWRITGCE